MHDDVMAEIGLRRMSEKRTDDPGHISLYPLIFFLENHPVAQAMKHQTKAPFKIRLRYIGIRDKNEPPDYALKHRSKHQNGPWKDDQVDTGQQVNKRQIPRVLDDVEPEFFVGTEMGLRYVLGVRNGR